MSGAPMYKCLQSATRRARSRSSWRCCALTASSVSPTCDASPAHALARDLPKTGIAYRHLPGLGGFRRPRPDSPNTAWRNASFRGYADYMATDEFASHLGALLDDARTAPTAIMCAEAVPWRCHRSLIADALLARGVQVRHILGLARAEPHVLTASARVEGGRVRYPREPDLFGAAGD